MPDSPVHPALPLLSHHPANRADKLNFNAYARAIANTLSHLKADQTGLTIGIFGDWGSGKSTLLDLVTDELRVSPTKFLLVEFEAWKYGKPEEVWVALLRSVIRRVEDEFKWTALTIRFQLWWRRLNLRVLLYQITVYLIRILLIFLALLAALAIVQPEDDAPKAQQEAGHIVGQPDDRARRHEDYDRYIVQEVVSLARQHGNNAEDKLLTTGCSMGAYHAANFFFRHPDVFDTVIAISGLYQLRMFLGDYVDDRVYFNSPLFYLPNLTDPWYIELYRRSTIIVCTGQGAWEDAMLVDAYALKRILDEKQIPAWIDIWGTDVNHDWPWWRVMMPYFLGKLEL